MNNPDLHDEPDTSVTRILVIDDNSPFVLPLIRSFSGYKNIHIDILLSSTEKPSHFRYSRFLGRIRRVDKLKDKNIETIIADVVSSFGSDILIPTREWITVLLINHKVQLSKFVKLQPLPDAYTIEVTESKWNLNQWLIANGFPFSVCSENLNEWSGGYPVLLKPVYGIGGKGIRLVESSAEMQKLLKNDNLNKKDFILQEYIEGYDIDVSFFANKGKIIYHTMQKGLISEGMEYSKGIKFVKNEDLLLLVSRMIDKLGYTGIAHLDFRYSEEKKQYILIDYNSRYWSSVQGSRAMGINFPYLVFLWVTQGETVKTMDYRTGYYYFSSTAAKTIIKNMFSGRKYPVKFKDSQLSYIFSDPFPEIMYLLRSLIGLQR